MPIIEHAFSYGGLLIRTFRHADAPPPPILPAPAPWPSEPPPKRRKGLSPAAVLPTTPCDATSEVEAAAQTRYWAEGCGADMDRFDEGEADYGYGYGADDGGVGLQTGAGTEGAGGCLPAPPPINEHGLYFPPPLPEPTAVAPPPPPHNLPHPPVPLTTTTTKRPRGRPRKASPATPKPTPHHCTTPSALLTHISASLASASSGFIPRPLQTTYTLPLPASESLYKPFAQALVRDIAAADRFSWTVAHSQWKAGNYRPGFTPVAKWICSLSEEVRYRGDGWFSYPVLFCSLFVVAGDLVADGGGCRLWWWEAHGEVSLWRGDFGAV